MTGAASLLQVLLLGLSGSQAAGSGTAVSRTAGDALASIERQLEAEIVKLGEETKINLRYNNMRKYEKIFIRIASMGTLAVSRNVQYAEINAVFQGDDDDEEDGDYDDDEEDAEERTADDTIIDFLIAEYKNTLAGNILEEEVLGLGPVSGDELFQLLLKKKGKQKATGRSNYVPQYPGEALFYTPQSYLLQVVGRALSGGGFMGSGLVGLKKLGLGCGVETWRSLRRQYSDLFSPAQSGRSRTELNYRLNQFFRTLRRELNCLRGHDKYDRGHLELLLSQLRLVLSEMINEAEDRKAPALLSDESLHRAMTEVYTSIDRARSLMASDWLRSSAVSLSLLLTKLAGFTLVTWGRNMGSWPQDVQFSNVSTAVRLGVLGRALLYALFTVEDFRTLLSYSPPSCDSDTLYSVLDTHSDLLYPGLTGEEREGLQGSLHMARFNYEARESVSCLTSTPSQFLDLDVLESPDQGRELEDRMEDLLGLVRLRVEEAS